MRRTPTAILSLALLAPLAACEPDPNESIFEAYGLSMAGPMVHLCGQRVRQGDVVSRWDAFASERSPEQLLEDYLDELGPDGLEREDPVVVWRLPPDAMPPERVITIQPASVPGPHRFCPDKPSTTTPSIMVLARRERPDTTAGAAPATGRTPPDTTGD